MLIRVSPVFFLCGLLPGTDVLQSTTGDPAVVDGVDRTMVITGQTTGAAPVVQPLGWRADDVVDRTYRHAFAATDTDVRIDCKLTVCDHPLVEIAADDV